MAGIERSAIDGLYTYDPFSSLVLFVLERFGFREPGGAAEFVRSGAIGPGGELPLNSSGGLLSEAQISGWNSIAEMVYQLRGEPGERQIVDAEYLQRATCWGDSVVLRRWARWTNLYDRCRRLRRTMPRSGTHVSPAAWNFPIARHGSKRLCRRPPCAQCASAIAQWRTASGLGTVSSWVVVHQPWFPSFAADIPYNVVQVELDEGPRLTTSVVGVNNDPLQIGMRVQVEFDHVSEAIALPRFRPL